jgi:hypothetical protein
LEDIYLDSDFIISFIKSNIEDYFNISRRYVKGIALLFLKKSIQN